MAGIRVIVEDIDESINVDFIDEGINVTLIDIDGINVTITEN